MEPNLTSPAGPLRVVLIDDHPLMRRGIKDLIEQDGEFAVCAELEGGVRAVEFLLGTTPDLIVIDLKLPDCNGLDLIGEIRYAGIRIPILVYSALDGNFHAQRAIRTGANGFLSKNENPQKILVGLRRILAGEIFLGEASEDVPSSGGSGDSEWRNPEQLLQSLSDREFSVFELLGEGLRSPEISQRLDISRRTVDTHRTRIRQRLGFATGADLIHFAVTWAQSNPVRAIQREDVVDDQESMSPDGEEPPAEMTE